MGIRHAFLALVALVATVSAQATHPMTNKVVKDSTYTACTYGPDGTKQVGLYSTLSNRRPLFIMVSGMS